jgi:hypothetical protein
VIQLTAGGRQVRDRLDRIIRQAVTITRDRDSRAA